MELSKLTDKELCKVREIFNDCDNFKYEENEERLLKLNDLYAFGGVFKFWLEYQTEKSVYNAIVYARLSVTCEMAERFYKNNLDN
jgi:hypothetical protein